MHDAKGRELKVGDIVIVPMRIRDVYPTPDYCNVTVESVLGRKPDGIKEVLTGNTAVMLRANVGDENDLAEFQR